MKHIWKLLKREMTNDSGAAIAWYKAAFLFGTESSCHFFLIEDMNEDIMS